MLLFSSAEELERGKQVRKDAPDPLRELPGRNVPVPRREALS